MICNIVRLLTFFLIFHISAFQAFNFAYAQMKIVDPKFENFEKREECLAAGGVWRQFGNGCADNCLAKFDKFSFCTMVVTYDCDCGNDSCYYNGKCYEVQTFKSVYEKIELEKKQQLDDEKKAREAQYMIKKNEIIESLIKRYNIPVDRENKFQSQSVSGNTRSSFVPNNNVANFYVAKEVLDQNGNNQIVYFNEINNSLGSNSNSSQNANSESSSESNSGFFFGLASNLNKSNDSKNSAPKSFSKKMEENSRETANSGISSIIKPMFINKVLENKLKRAEAQDRINNQNNNSESEDENLKKLPIIPIEGD